MKGLPSLNVNFYMQNFQFIPYTLIAVALINAVYKHNDSGSLLKSLLLIVFGGAIFLASRISGFKNTYTGKNFQLFVLILSTLLILLTLF